jgi:peptidoglycan hydrolase-like protein with peptidoglycan-binding domain
MGQMGTGSQAPAAPRAGGPNGQADADQVRGLQKALQDKGMNPGAIDGVSGPKTEAAIRAFQREQKLPETGRLDPQTRERLGMPRQ